MTKTGAPDRRRFLQATLALGAATAASEALFGFPQIPAGTPTPGRESGSDFPSHVHGPRSGPLEVRDDVSPAEDLMREHGVLKRVLLVYDEAVRRLDAGTDLPPETIADSAGIIRTFIEDYHEKLEENFLFPRFRKAHQLVELVDVLTAQHQAGRRVTDTTIRLANAKSIRDAGEKKQLADSLRSFVRMYAPTRRARTRSCFRRSGRSCRRTSTTRSATSSKTRSTAASARTASRGTWTRSPESKRSSGSTNWLSSRRRRSGQRASFGSTRHRAFVPIRATTSQRPGTRALASGPS